MGQGVCCGFEVFSNNVSIQSNFDDVLVTSQSLSVLHECRARVRDE